MLAPPASASSTAAARTGRSVAPIRATRRLRDGAGVVERDLGDGAAGGVVAGALGDLDARGPGARRSQRQGDGDEDLVVVERRGEEAEVEVGGGDRALAAGTAGDHAAVEGDQGGGQLGGGVGVGDAAADGPARADLRVADLGQRRA